MSPHQPTLQIINEIKRAWMTGRSIVPIVGAGLSADSGFPTVGSIVRYFGKFHHYLALRTYLPPPRWQPTGSVFAALHSRYSQEPWTFADTNGWLDRFQLNQDLVTHISAEDKSGICSKSAIEDKVRNGLEHAARLIRLASAAGLQRLKFSDALDANTERTLSMALAPSSGRHRPVATCSSSNVADRYVLQTPPFRVGRHSANQGRPNATWCEREAISATEGTNSCRLRKSQSVTHCTACNVVNSS
jgi:hypothetical protein